MESGEVPETAAPVVKIAGVTEAAWRVAALNNMIQKTIPAFTIFM